MNAIEIDPIDRAKLSASFYAKVIPTNDDECWPWLGFAMINYKSRDYSYRRVIFALFIGPLTSEQAVVTTCKTTDCANPRHLRPRRRQSDSDSERRAKILRKYRQPELAREFEYIDSYEYRHRDEI